MRSLAILAATALVGVSSVAHAGPKADIQSIDAATARIAVQPRTGQKFAEMRKAYLRAASEETLRRGYDWFELGYVVDTTRQRDIEVPVMERSVSGSGSSGPYLTAFMGTSTVVPPIPTRVFEPGVDTLVRFGKGARPDRATAADARATLAALK